MASDFARRRFEWLDQVCADRGVRAAVFQLAYAISGFVNRETGDAWPSQETLAKHLGLSVRGVRKLTDVLGGRGHLEITESRGRGHSTRYRPILKVTVVDEPQKSLFPDEPAAPPQDAPGAFEEFWRHYPRKVAKGAARRAFERVVKNGANTAEIIAGTMRYGAERGGEPERYTKHPATWLNGECWHDMPAKPTGPGPSGPIQPQRRETFADLLGVVPNGGGHGDE
jgi:hypothetical protein